MTDYCISTDQIGATTGATVEVVGALLTANIVIVIVVYLLHRKVSCYPKAAAVTMYVPVSFNNLFDIPYFPVRGQIKGTDSHCKCATALYTKWSACISF